MTYRVSVKLESKIFQPGAVRRALEHAVTKAAKDFKFSTRAKMVDSPHTGANPARVRGESFAATRRRSARGERPQRQSGNLERNVKDIKTSDLSAAVYVDEAGAPYARLLVEDLGRIIMSEQDRAEAEINLTREANLKIQSLL